MESSDRPFASVSENGESDAVLTAEEGFAAMYAFLNMYWNEFKTANLADVLGDLQPARGGLSSDPAAWTDWLKSVEAVLAQRSQSE
jgi:hypothetical protein